MSEYTLSANPALGGYDQMHDGLHLREIDDLAVVSIALPLGGGKATEKAVSSAFGIGLPAAGTFLTAKDGAERLVRLGHEQMLVMFSRETPDAEPAIAALLGGAAYTTDQTDVWVGLEISGAKARNVLERICPIDLHADAFGPGSAARTAMEHLGTLILCTGADTFVLLSASSSARSFLHALKVSIRNVI